MIRKLTLALALLAIAEPALAQSGLVKRLGGRIRDAGVSAVTRSDAGPGTVMAWAPTDDGGLVLLSLDTAVQRSMTCYAIQPSDVRTFHRKVEIGSTFTAVRFLTQEVDVGEITCHMVRTWTARKKGNPFRREFLVGPQGYRAQVLAYALRNAPEAAEYFFPHGAELMPAAGDLASLVRLFQHFGLDLEDVKAALE